MCTAQGGDSATGGNQYISPEKALFQLGSWGAEDIFICSPWG